MNLCQKAATWQVNILQKKMDLKIFTKKKWNWTNAATKSCHFYYKHLNLTRKLWYCKKSYIKIFNLKVTI